MYRHNNGSLRRAAEGFFSVVNKGETNKKNLVLSWNYEKKNMEQGNKTLTKVQKQ